ncbi:HpcH/HpaI aldolase/citrate lyase family protein [Taylorella equigenitalis]|uniref:HpcH/HpaI aldolase/citrate lyase family protein n=1 Tax=Taylorella equigenitalis TaxID=29575 RepID=UPI00237DF51F|nr:CoA ester lyase [Taylorella equigenitalis]WDU51838.1 CoA ester lyase [Taylorella equigenitalis]
MGAIIRSGLFVPATRTDRVSKAVATGADIVIVDLEDAVGPLDKATARDALADYLVTASEQNLCVRLNSDDTQWHEEDLALCEKFKFKLFCVMLPKVETADQVHAIYERTGLRVITLIETARGLVALREIASSSGTLAMSIGELDLGISMGLPVTGSDVEIDAGLEFLMKQIYADLAIASSCAGIQGPLASVYSDYKNVDGYASRLKFAKGMGFAGGLCIHPKQVGVVKDVFAIDPELLAWAQSVMDAVVVHGESAFSLNGQMVDKPIIERAKRILGL